MKGVPKPVPASKRWRFRLEVALARSLEGLVRLLSRRGARRLGSGLGFLVYYLSPSLRRVALANLELVFPQFAAVTRRRIARASLQNMAATMVTLAWSRRLTAQNLREYAIVDEPGLAKARAVMAQGRPVIFITAHFGDWELLGQSIGFYGTPVTVVQEAMLNEPLAAWFAGLRAVSGHRLVPNRHAARELLKTLRGGGAIALLVDLNSTRKRGGEWLKFFGLPVFSSTAAGALAKHSGAAIFGGIGQPLVDGRIELRYGYEIPWSPDEDAAAITQRCLEFCERRIRDNPAAWLWGYKRWKYKPTPDAAGYPAYARHVQL